MEGGGSEEDVRGAISVLLADDAPELRELVRFGIEEDPLLRVVWEAGDGRAAVEGVDAVGPHAAVLDLSMPHMDGYQAIAEIRNRSPEIAIIVLSGFPAERVRALVMEQGADEFVEKGAPIAELRDLIHRLVERRRADAERHAA
jgi:DNA-binding NarL/FixJ family response regulator